MRHFDSREEYHDAIDARLDDFDADESLEEIARTTIVTYRGDVARGTLETVEPDLRWGWSPLSIIERSEYTPERTVPDSALKRLEGYVSVSSAAYYVLIADLEDARERRSVSSALTQARWDAHDLLERALADDIAEPWRHVLRAYAILGDVEQPAPDDVQEARSLLEEAVSPSEIQPWSLIERAADRLHEEEHAVEV